MAAKKLGSTTNPLAAYCHMPDHVSFVGADDQEKIILILRKHPITNIPWILMAMLLIVMPIPLVYFPILSFLPERFQIILVLFWYLATTAFILERFVTWFFNVNIVTDERVFDVDFYNLVYREISDAELKDIQDVTSTIGSVIRTSFDYGNVTIQTSAEIPQLEFEAVPHPDEVAKILRDLRVEEEQEALEGRVR